jgi:hypothetical protein
LEIEHGKLELDKDSLRKAYIEKEKECEELRKDNQNLRNKL